MSNQRYEQGGVVNFLVVAIIFALVLGGVIWVAKERIKPYGTNTSQTNSEQTAGTADPSSTTATSGDTSSSASTDANSGANSKSDSTASTDSSASSGSSGSASGSTAQAQTNTSSAGNVASTGPTQVEQVASAGASDVIFGFVAISLTAASTYWFFQSRKRLYASALK